jgi:hypothetical protein
MDLPNIERAFDATEWCGGLPTEQRSGTWATGSVRSLGFLVRMESILTVKSVGMEGAPGLSFRFPAESTRGA